MADKVSPEGKPVQQVALKHTADPSYMHRPPRIVPNYGKKHRGTLPKSNISRVLLYDNVTQQQMLDVKISHLRAEQRKTGRLMDMHRKSFIVRRLQKQRHVADTVLHVQDALGHKDAPGHKEDTGNNSHNINGRLGVATYAFGYASIGAVAKANSVDATGDPSLTEDHEVTTDRRSSEDAGHTEEIISVSDSHGDSQQTLPNVHHDRNGAVTSDGFVHNAPDDTAGKHASSFRPTQTAMMYRDLRLPDIHGTSGGSPAQIDKVILRVDSDRHGLTRMLHTFHEPSWRTGKKKNKRPALGHVTVTSSTKAAEDDRYRQLERLLVRDIPRSEGYLELSPSFHSPRQSGSFTRPTTRSIRSHTPSASASPVPLSVTLSTL
ncbi:hypothetical protein BaRGS_00008411 [Batillaria attramentaria]|uniref:Uncharacterized protein n=1 Tax=Batillaria attramentaria TaxID=370345 RepID=A0ABD0LM76_9CAEN